MPTNFAIERNGLTMAYLYCICKNNDQQHLRGHFYALGFLLLSAKSYGHVLGKFFSME